jgi:hypothetical protein
VKGYAAERHAPFTPTIVAAVDALSVWGMHTRAAQLFRYWLVNFVRQDGTIDYYGPALSEYGQLLHMAALLHERAGGEGWWDESRGALQRAAGHIVELCLEADKGEELVPGVPEADISSGEPLHTYDPTHSEANRYFHNNAWLARGLARWDTLTGRTGIPPTHAGTPDIAGIADRLSKRTLAAIRETWPDDPADWWLSPQVEQCPRPASLHADSLASYTNYRYWPELLSSGILPADMANRLVESRIAHGGQFCGMTRLFARLDDWPLADHLFALWRLGRKDDFLLSLYGHVSYHQAQGHLTAYEQVTLPPGREKAPYCLPCQLVAARAARLLVAERG